MAERTVIDTAEWAVPGYTALRELGTGGFGRVVLARHDTTGTLVAIKYLKADLLDDPGFAEMFRSEAEVLASVDDPNVVRLYEYVESPSGSAIVMELVDGLSLRQILAHQGQTTPEAALVVLQGSLVGLAAVHQHGIVHRDYKPENVLVNGNGASKLTDFGIAARTGARPYAAGTIAYAAPEQMKGGPATPAADVYAATATFYECLTGRPPFIGETAERVMYQHLFEPVNLEPVPVPLRPLVETGMAKEPERRPTDGTTFIAALRAAAAGAYGPDWEERGHSNLGEAALLLAALWPVGAPPGVQGFAVQHVQLAQKGAQQSRHLWHLKHLRHLAHLRRLHPVRTALAVGAGATLAVAAGLYAFNLAYPSGGSTPSPTPTSTHPVTIGPPPPTAPAVAGLFPATGSNSGGTLVTITGTRLDGPVFVKFGAKDGKITLDLNTKITVISPPGQGTVVITVITPGGTGQAGEFSYRNMTVQVKAPKVGGFFPSNGPAAGGTLVTINGTNLADPTKVSFGGAAGMITHQSGTQITVTSPPGQGTVGVTVTTAGGTANVGTFSYNPTPTSPPPSTPHSSPPPVRTSVTGFSPTSGPTTGGTVVTITGSGLAHASKVSFGGSNGTITSDSSTRLTVKSPSGNKGTVTVTVTTPDGAATAGKFTYNPPPPPPTPVVTGVSPPSGPVGGGTSVTITGTNLANASKVSFGSTTGKIIADSSTQITATSPAYSSFTVITAKITVNITVTTSSGTSAVTSADQFTYVPAPVISGIKPSSGPTGVSTTVIISGQNLSGATGVSFGGAAADSFTVDSSTEITASSPSGSAGTVNITVTTPGGTSAITEADQFTYVVPAPTITSISPTSANEGTGITVEIFGTNLSGATLVSFGGEGNGKIISDSNGEIVVTAPEFCATVTITVTTPGGTASSPEQFSENCLQ